MENNWEELKNTIKDSSPDFYQIIENLSLEDFPKTEKKIQTSLHKYFNRAAFRSTPFGAFASVGIAKLENNTSGKIEITKEQNLHSFTDWAVKSTIEYDPAELLNANVEFFANTSYYRVQNEIRYLQKVEDSFEMTAIDFDPIIVDILSRLTVPKFYNTIVEETKPVLKQDELNDYLHDLISIQLIITSQQPNIIGPDYFKRIGRPSQIHEKRYLIAERTTLDGSLNKEHFKQLPAVAEMLSRMVQEREETDLENFKKSFSQRFELAEIPIMIALDPEIGIGYGEMTVDGQWSPLIQKLSAQTGGKIQNIKHNFLKERLSNILLNKGLEQVIELEDLMTDQEMKKLLPNSLNAVCSLNGSLVYLDYLGGATSNAMSGRFAFAIPAIKEFCDEIAAMETKANPDVIFFDVGYTKEDHVDNINRRPSLYDFQLNLLNYDISKAPLSLTDIMISIQRNEVVLRSASLDKRLIPRVASAYNHQRSDLPLFRFLIDLQNQGIQTNLLFRPASLIPGLARYPRIQFRNIVVSPASFRINSEILKGLTGLSHKVIFLQQYLQDHLPYDYYKVGKGDQTLCLNVHSIMDTEVLFSLLDKVEALYLEETAVGQTPFVRDESGHPYHPQLVLTLTHSDQIVTPLIFNQVSSITKEKPCWIPPGKDWLYFELYCSPQRSDVILDERIKHYLSQFQARFKKWFFIRYREGGEHIRLRIQLYDAKDAGEMTRALTGLLQEELNYGTISDIKLCTYKKEVHRYSNAMINDVENHFQKDSNYILQMLQFMLPDMAKYKLCLDIFQSVQSSQLFTGDSFKNTLTKVAHSLSTEHNIQPDGFKEINKQYKDLLVQVFPSLSEAANILHADLKNSFISTLQKCPVISRPNMFASLFHMHVNRLFRQQQRTHELLIYHFGLIDYNRKLHQDKAKANY